MTTTVTCKLELHVLLPWECALQHGHQRLLMHLQPYCVCQIMSHSCRQPATESTGVIPAFQVSPLLLRKVTLQHPLTEMSEHRGCKGMCPTVEPYFPALDSATAVRFAPVCPAVLIMLDLGSEEFTLRLSEYLQIRRSAVNSAFFFPDMISICQRVGVSGSHVTFIPL